MKKFLILTLTFIVSAYSHAGYFLEIGTSQNDTDVNSLSFLNPTGSSATSNTVSGNFINLENLSQNNQQNGTSFKIGMDYSGFDMYLVKKSFGTAQATGTATFGAFDFTQRLMLDVDVMAFGLSYPIDLGNNHSIAPLIEFGQADIDASGQQISPVGTFNLFPNKSNDDSTFAYGITYAYGISEGVELTASYIQNDLGDANTGVTGTGISGMNAGEQLQSEVEVTELMIGLRVTF